MNKDKEPEHLASFAMSKEEIASRQRVTKNPRSTKNSQPAATSKALWALTIFALLVSGALLVQFQQVKKQSALQLQAITILQERLIDTGEQSNLSVDAIKIIMNDQDHEIRKLWDLANKSNKNQIRKNKQRLDEQNKLITKYAGKVDLIGKDQAKSEKSLLKAIKDSSNESSQGLSQLQSNVDAQSVKFDKSIASLPKNLSKTLNSYDAKIKAIPKGLAKTLKDHGKGIKAMDATRLQLIKRINALDKELKALKKSQTKKVTAPAAS